MHSSRNDSFFTKADFDSVRCSPAWPADKLSLVSEMIRFNALATIAYVNSGHIGASLSAVEVLTVLYHHVMRLDPWNPRKHGRDTFILSKGHGAAGQYAALASVGFIAEDALSSFRKFGGLQGHVDVSVPGIDANTGSLGMGLSKGKGYAWAAKADGTGARAFVMVGDGELQEGQNWEAIQSAAHMKLDNLYLIVDRNMVQTDREVSRILDVSPLEEKLKCFGWDVMSIDGNSVSEVMEAFRQLGASSGRPKAIIANTVKGKGVSFMEHPAAIAKDGWYRWHAGMPDKEEYRAAYEELSGKIRGMAQRSGIALAVPQFSYPDRPASPFKGASLKPAFSESLLELASRKKELVVLDGDLAEDCGLGAFERQMPEQFMEIGIAEQDMVSTAGGLALAGKLPVVNTYTAFLTSRSNEQIFNNASEKTKVIYIGHLAGLLPAKPGKSHQGIRDISVLRAIPGLIICAPCSPRELKEMMRFLVMDAARCSYMRLEHVPPRKDVLLPEDYKLEFGKGTILAEGRDAVAIAYGPLMVSEALLAREELLGQGISLRVVNLPWINSIDEKWLAGAISGTKHVFCIENHSSRGGQAEEVRKALGGNGCVIEVIGVDGLAQSGDNEDVLKHYGLDHASIAKRISGRLKG